MNGRLPYVIDTVYPGLLIVAVAAIAVISIIVIVRIFRGSGS